MDQLTKNSSRKREPLSPDRIVEAAFEVIAAEGLAEFSTRKLARKLGCEAMSIYHHFPSKAHLMDALVDSAVASMRPIPPELDFIEGQRFAAFEYRAMGLKRPAFFPYLSVHRMNTLTALNWLDRTLSCYRKAGFSDRDAAHYFRQFGYYIIGAVLDETAGYARGPSTAAPVPFEVLKRDFPNVLSAGPHFSQGEWQRIFELGLEIELDGLRRALAAAAGGGPAFFVP
jgi:AcrR family transcriptional regulator